MLAILFGNGINTCKLMTEQSHTFHIWISENIRQGQHIYLVLFLFRLLACLQDDLTLTAMRQLLSPCFAKLTDRVRKCFLVSAWTVHYSHTTVQGQFMDCALLSHTSVQVLVAIKTDSIYSH